MSEFKTASQVKSYVLEEGSLCALSSNQMIDFASGVIFAMHGFEIPKEYYPLPSSKWLGKQYAGTDIEFWQVALWSMGAMIQTHMTDLGAFGVEFDTWKRERSLHQQPMEPFATYCFVTNGVVRNTGAGTRCTYCGKRMGINTICAPCYKSIDPFNVDIVEWAKSKNLAIDYISIWDGFNQ